MREISFLPANQGGTVIIASKYNVQHAASHHVGDAVIFRVTFQYDESHDSSPPLPFLNYSVQVTASQPCFVSVDNKTSVGFDVTLTPISDIKRIKAGTIDVTVSA